MQSARSGPLRRRHPVRRARSGPSARPSRTSAPPTASCRPPSSGPSTSSRWPGASSARSRTCPGPPSRSPAPASRPWASPRRCSASPTRRGPTAWPPCSSSPRWPRPPTPHLAGINLGPDQALIGPLAHERNTFSDDLTQVRTTLARTSEAAAVGRHHPAGSRDLPAPGRATTPRCAPARARSSRPGSSRRATASSTSPTCCPPPPSILPPGAVTVGGDLEARWGCLHPGAGLAQPGAHAAVRRQRPAGRQHVEGEHGPERRRGPRHRRRRGSRTSWR